MRDLRYVNKKITVLMKFSGTNYLVAQGDCYYEGLTEKYMEFSNYSDALNYFLTIKQ